MGENGNHLGLFRWNGSMTTELQVKSEVLVQNKVRQEIIALEDKIRAISMTQEFTPNLPLKHHFAPGSYCREIFIPAGMMVIGKIHKHAHINVLSKGHVLVYTENGPEEFEAPRTWTSEPGTKRVVYAVTDVIWNTIHVTEETDLEAIEDFVIAKTYEEYEAFKGLCIEKQNEVIS